jgi:hypothetical protein
MADTFLRGHAVSSVSPLKAHSKCNGTVQIAGDIFRKEMFFSYLWMGIEFVVMHATIHIRYE